MKKWQRGIKHASKGDEEAPMGAVAALKGDGKPLKV